jgi:hypothetical protein
MPSKPPPRAKAPAPAKPPRPALPTIDVDIDWLEPPTRPKNPARDAAAETPRRDTIPVQPEWLEVDEEPAPAPAAPARRVPRPAVKTAKKSSSPPKRKG